MEEALKKYQELSIIFCYIFHLKENSKSYICIKLQQLLMRPHKKMFCVVLRKNSRFFRVSTTSFPCCVFSDVVA